MNARSILILAASALAVSACGQPAADADSPPDAASQSSVERVGPETAAPTTPTPAQAAIQTQPAADGVQVALNRVQVTGDVMTVQTIFSNPNTNGAGFRFLAEEVNVIDDATAQRYGILRDSSDRWQASPMESAGSNHISFGVSQGGSEVVWFKFPAPPVTSATVSINIPGVGPFDGVAVTR